MIHKFRINKNTHFQTSPGGDFRGAQKLAYDHRSLCKRLVTTKQNLSQNSEPLPDHDG